MLASWNREKDSMIERKITEFKYLQEPSFCQSNVSLSYGLIPWFPLYIQHWLQWLNCLLVLKLGNESLWALVNKRAIFYYVTSLQGSKIHINFNKPRNKYKGQRTVTSHSTYLTQTRIILIAYKVTVSLKQTLRRQRRGLCQLCDISKTKKCPSILVKINK